jgi:8-hydroxy-5-deazaflavin:NADPH oxidoreductase
MPALFTKRDILAGCLFPTVFPSVSFAEDTKPKIGLIGAGRIGSQLAALWAHAGYQIMISARDLGPLKDIAAQIGPNVQVGTPRQAASFGDVIVVTVPYGALPQIGRDYASELNGKVVLDTCNPNPKRDGDMTKDALEKGTGVMDPIYLPGTRLVRAFNTVGAGQLAPNSNRSGEWIGIPLATNDKDAMLEAAQLVRDAGFEPVLVGNLSTAKSFDTGTPIYGKALTASDVRTALHVKISP